MTAPVVLYMTPSDYFSFSHRLSKIWTRAEHQTAFLEATYNRVSLKETDGCIAIVTTPQITPCRGGCVAGVSGWYTHNQKAIMRWHGILPRYRGQGLSKVLLTWILRNVKERGFAELYELSDSEEAKGYFLKMGFVEVTDVVERGLVQESGCIFQYVLKIVL